MTQQVEQVGSGRLAADDVFAKMAEELKHQVIELDTSYSMNEKFQDGSLGGRTKMEVARAMLTAEAKRRVTIGPLFSLCKFTYTSTELTQVGEPLANMLAAIELLKPEGGTAIGTAVTDGITRLEANPSPAGVNHLIIVTDAEDTYMEETARHDAKRANGAGVAVDIILINPDPGDGTAEAGLKLLAKLAQGRFAKVQDADGLEIAFRELASRTVLLLGA